MDANLLVSLVIILIVGGALLCTIRNLRSGNCCSKCNDCGCDCNNKCNCTFDENCCCKK